jgi:glycosyltransferase involved in cell wall biosynthesis
MFSIVVSSYKEENFKSLKKSIDSTIGVDYELIKICNNGEFGICEAYNKGIKKVKYGYVIFCHEDIIFHNENWGKKLIELFESDTLLGLVGIAGSEYKSYAYSGWSYPNSDAFISMYLKQSSGSVIDTDQFSDSKLIKFREVATVDGCFMATKKSILDFVSFDDVTFKDFHCYDLDFSLQIGKSHKVVVSNTVLLNHLSHGDFSHSWADETIKLHKKWEEKLPIYRGNNPQQNDFIRYELGAYEYFLERCIGSRDLLLKILYKNFSIRYLKIIGVKIALYNFINSLFTIHLFKKAIRVKDFV